VPSAPGRPSPPQLSGTAARDTMMA